MNPTQRTRLHRAGWFISIAALVGAGAFAIMWILAPADPRADPTDPRQVALGAKIYARECASCHGKRLEGQPEWHQRKPNGRLPAPPHDANGHTWHHPDAELFKLTKLGLAPFAGADYRTDMPSFEDKLADEEIWAALAYIKSTWPQDIRARQDLRDRAARNR